MAANEIIANEHRSQDFRIGLRCFYMVSFLWVACKMLHFEAIFARDPALVRPLHWFGLLLFSLGMPPLIYYILACAAMVVCIYIAASERHSFVLQAYLMLCLMVMNTLKLSTGYIEHVDHLFMLAHFFLLSYKKEALNALYVKYFQVGLLFTYSISGLLKYVTLVGKVLFTEETTWLDPQALYYQTYLLYEEMHRPMPDWMRSFLKMGIVPLLLVQGTFIIETLAVFAAARYTWIRYYLAWIIAFHLFNYVFFQISFPFAALTALCFMCPFSELKGIVKSKE